MRKALGRGLDALLPQAAPETPPSLGTTGTPMKIPIAKLRPNHLQPRRHFDPERLSELAASIKQHGLAQPLLVSSDGDGTYELIAGERRLRACELAGLKEVDVFVRKPATDTERMALTLIENLQREDLNALETALGYQRLIKEFGLTQKDVGEMVGKSASAVSNTLRILDLPEDVQKAIQFGQLQEGHARGLLMVHDPIKRHELFRMIAGKDLTVRQVEDLAREMNAQVSGDAPRQELRPEAKPSPDIKEFEDLIQRRLGTRVRIRTGASGAKGTLTIHFYSTEDFERVVEIITK